MVGLLDGMLGRSSHALVGWKQSTSGLVDSLRMI